MYPRLALNSWSSCLRLLSVEIIGVSHHTWLKKVPVLSWVMDEYVLNPNYSLEGNFIYKINYFETYKLFLCTYIVYVCVYKWNHIILMVFNLFFFLNTMDFDFPILVLICLIDTYWADIKEFKTQSPCSEVIYIWMGKGSKDNELITILKEFHIPRAICENHRLE
jgi:hypothetical protein